ncbi:MAG: metallophosphoesterase [Clostridiales bacterium]|nr:metallophosphoesterase [Clostridiales bacterium]
MKFKKVVSLLLFVCMLTCVFPSAYAVSSLNQKKTDFGLKFDVNGNFRIMQIADIQDYHNIEEGCLDLLSLAIKEYHPNLIVLTGDNTISTGTTYRFKNTIQQFISTFNGTPFVVTFGNHDSESGPSRADQYNLYVENGALNFDNNFSSIDLNGVGSGCLTILDNKGNNVAWNLILLDSGTYDDNGGYGKPGYNDKKSYNNEEGYQRVVNYVRTVNEDMKSFTADGDYAPTLAFQHIPLHEFYTTGIVVPCNEGDEGAFYSDDKKVDIPGYYRPNTDNPTVTGNYLESACCSATSTLELYKAFAEHENVKGIFYGHDHKNTLMGEGTYKDLDGTEYKLVQGYCKASTFKDYNDGNQGVRIFDLHLDGTYDTRMVTRSDLNVRILGENHYYIDQYENNSVYVSDLRASFNSRERHAVSELTDAGYTVIDKDLNDGSGGDYIYLGYKTTSSKNDAITDIMLVKGGEANKTRTEVINGKNVVYQAVTSKDGTVVDFNKGCGGEYIYCYYTKDTVYRPITSIAIDVKECMAEYNTVMWYDEPALAADLNKGAKGDYIYLHYKRYGKNVDRELEILDDFTKRQNEQIIKDNYAEYYNESSLKALNDALGECSAILNAYNESLYSDKYGPAEFSAARQGVLDALDKLAVDVTLDPNGGKIAPTVVAVVVGTNREGVIYLNELVPENDDKDYVFGGWALSKDASDGIYEGMKITGATTLYALWTYSPSSDTDTENTDTSSDNTDTSKDTSTDTSTDNTDTDVKAMPGDVNCDGKVDMLDVTALQRIIAKLTTHENMGKNSFKNSDCNYDSYVNMQDVTLIQKYIAKLVDKL